MGSAVSFGCRLGSIRLHDVEDVSLRVETLLPGEALPLMLLAHRTSQLLHEACCRVEIPGREVQMDPDLFRSLLRDALQPDRDPGSLGRGEKGDKYRLGAIYGLKAPDVDASKPARTWQTLDITLVDRHVTVILNGQTIIDNQPVLGCTGGALWSDPLRPGPIYLQGNHSDIDYRNIVLRPAVE